jgi:peptide/nickel transport system substrate-binding protein
MSAFCDPAKDARMQQVMTTELTDMDAAARQWAELDREMTDLAPIMPLFQISRLDLVSSRVGHFMFSPLFHLIFSEIWVR